MLVSPDERLDRLKACLKRESVGNKLCAKGIRV